MEKVLACQIQREKEAARWWRWSSKPVWGSKGPRRVRLPPFSANLRNPLQLKINALAEERPLFRLEIPLRR
jgi:hypothetical protein